MLCDSQYLSWNPINIKLHIYFIICLLKYVVCFTLFLSVRTIIYLWVLLYIWHVLYKLTLYSLLSTVVYIYVVVALMIIIISFQSSIKHFLEILSKPRSLIYSLELLYFPTHHNKEITSNLKYSDSIIDNHW